MKSPFVVDRQPIAGIIREKSTVETCWFFPDSNIMKSYSFAYDPLQIPPYLIFNTVIMLLYQRYDKNLNQQKHKLIMIW